ncbi:hypothetical protein VUR80DRAFT_1333 [Thermomyces stellatus]
MSRSAATRRRRRRDLENKFIVPPKGDQREAPEAGIARRGEGIHAEDRVSKRKRKGRRSAEKVRRRIQRIVSGIGVSEVSIQWENGTRNTFKLPKHGDSGPSNGEKQREDTEGPSSEAGKPACSACGIRADAAPSDDRNSSLNPPEAPNVLNTTSDLVVNKVTSKGPSLAMPESQLGEIAPDQPALSRRPSVSPPEIPNSQASEDSSHDFQEYPELEERLEPASHTRGTQTTPRARRAGSVEIPLGYSPELNQVSRDRDVDAEADQSVSWPAVFGDSPPRARGPCSVRETDGIVPSSPPRKLPDSTAGRGISDAFSESSQELPALHPGSDQPPATRHLTTSNESPRNKRHYDPYEITPTPPKKRVLRSSGKLFTTPPWEMNPEQESQSAPGGAKTPVRRRSGLLRGEPVVSEAELVSIFSDPDPEFDRFGESVPKPNTAVAEVNDDGALVETSKGNVKGVKVETTPTMPPCSRALCGWKEDKGELSDDTSYTGVMSTPLRNYGKAPRIASQPRPGLISAGKRTPARKIKPRGTSSSGSRRSVSKSAAARIAELPTSPTADDTTSSPRSKTSTRATTPASEVTSKPIDAVKPELKPRGMSLVPGIPSSGRRRSSSSAPDIPPCFSNSTPCVSKETPSAGSGMQGSWAAKSTPVGHMEQTSINLGTENASARIEIPIPTVKGMASRTSGSSQPERRVEKEKTEKEKASRKTEGKSQAKKETNRETRREPKTDGSMSKKAGKAVEEKAIPGRDWVAPEKRTPVPLPPYVAMMRK